MPERKLRELQERIDGVLEHYSEDDPADRKVVAVTHPRHNWIALVAVILLAIGVGIAAKNLFDAVNGPKTQLAYPSPFKVTSHILNVDAPSAGPLTPLVIVSVKCNRSKEPIQVVGSPRTFVSVSPAGSTVDLGALANVREPGCTTTTNTLPIPQTVMDRTIVLCNQLHLPYMEWKITAVETPLDPDIKPVSFESETFRVYPKG